MEITQGVRVTVSEQGADATERRILAMLERISAAAGRLGSTASNSYNAFAAAAAASPAAAAVGASSGGRTAFARAPFVSGSGSDAQHVAGLMRQAEAQMKLNAAITAAVALGAKGADSYRKLDASLGALSSAAEKAAGSLGKVGQRGAGGGRGGDPDGFADALTQRLLPGLFATNVAANLVADGIQKMVGAGVNAATALAGMYLDALRTGVEFNSMVETSQLGIASLLTAFGQFRDAQGNVAGGAESFAAAQRLSAAMIEQVRIATLETTATFPEMIRALQEGMPSALKAGFDPTQVVSFTKAMAQAAGAIGLPIDQLGQEIRGVFDVDLSKNSRIARMLFAGIGMSADELREKMAQMTAPERFDFLMKRLEAFGLAGEQLSKTTAGALSNLQDAYQQIMGAGTVGMTEDFTTAVLKLSDSFLVVDENGKKAFDPKLVAGIKDSYESLDAFGLELVEAANILPGIAIEGENTFAAIGDAIGGATQKLAIFSRFLKEVGPEGLVGIAATGPIGVAVAHYKWAQAKEAVENEQRWAETWNPERMAARLGPHSNVFQHAPAPATDQMRSLLLGQDSKPLLEEVRDAARKNAEASDALKNWLASAGTKTAPVPQSVQQWLTGGGGAAGPTPADLLSVGRGPRGLQPSDMSRYLLGQAPERLLTFSMDTSIPDDKDYGERLASLRQQLEIMRAQADAAGLVNDLERARAQVKVDQLRADQQALSIINQIDDNASPAQRKEAERLAAAVRIVGYRQAEEAYQRKLGEHNEKQNEAKTRELNTLEDIHRKQQELLGGLEAETPLQEKINRLLADRDEQIARIQNMKHLDGTAEGGVTKKEWEISRTQAVYDEAVSDALTDELTKFHAGMAKMMADLRANIAEQTARDFVQNVEDMGERGDDLLKRMRAHWGGHTEELVTKMGDAVSGSLAAAATGAGHRIGQIAGQTFNELVAAGSSTMVQNLTIGIAGLFGDQITQGADGRWHVSGQKDAFDSFEAAASKTKGGKILGGAAAGAQIGLSGYEMGKAPGGRTAATTGGLMAGAGAGAMYGASAGPMGIVIGAFVGMLVGAIGGLLGEQAAQKDYKYGIPYIGGNGVAGFRGQRNMQDAEVQKAIAAAQGTFDTLRNAYVRLMLELPNSIIPELKYIDGKFQDNPSSKYMKHLEEWLTQKLPREIAGQFRQGMEDAFVSAGMDRARFATLWRETDKMDPKLAVQFWTDMAAGISAFHRAQQNMQAVQQGGARGRFDAEGNLRESGETEFRMDLRASASNMYALARQMVNMTGPERAAAFRALGEGIESVTRSLQAYIESLGDALVNIRQRIADDRLAVQIEREEDPNKKAELMRREAQRNLWKINNAVSLGLSPDQIEELVDRNRDLYRQMYDLDPSQKAYEWYIRQLDGLETAAAAAVAALGKAATGQVNAFIATLKPFQDYMLGLPVNLAPAWAALDASITGAAAALRELETAIRTNPTTPPSNPIPPNAPGGEPPPRPGTPNQPTNNSTGTTAAAAPAPVYVTVNVQNAYGPRDFQRQMTAAAAAAFRRNPDLAEPTF